MRHVFFLVLAFSLAGCSYGAGNEVSNPSEPVPPLEDRPADQMDANPNFTEDDPAPKLANLGVAPELTNQVWLNSEKALRLADLRGKVVLLEMWTFG